MNLNFNIKNIFELIYYYQAASMDEHRDTAANTADRILSHMELTF